MSGLKYKMKNHLEICRHFGSFLSAEKLAAFLFESKRKASSKMCNAPSHLQEFAKGYYGNDAEWAGFLELSAPAVGQTEEEKRIVFTLAGCRGYFSFLSRQEILS